MIIPRLVNDVWSSSDGENWTLATDAPTWNPTRLHSSVVFNNLLWVIGGYSDLCNNEVHFSSNGSAWFQASSVPDWLPRYGHTSVVFDDKIWVMGGYDEEDSYCNDVWYSSDGLTWKEETGVGWVARKHHTSVVFDNKIWVMGGDKGGTPVSDVWCHHLFLPSLTGYRYLFDEFTDTVPDEANALLMLPTQFEISKDCFWPGNHWLHVRSIDSQGNMSPTTHHKFTVDQETPIVLSSSHPDPEESYGQRDANFLWNTEQDCSAFYYTFNQQIDTVPEMLPANLIGNTVTATKLYVGTYYLHVYGVDDSLSECNIPTETAHFQINIREALPPVVNFSFDAPTGNVAFSWEDTDDFANGDPPYYYILNNDPEFVITPDGADVTGTNTTARVYPRRDPGVWFFHILSADKAWLSITTVPDSIGCGPLTTYW